MKGNSRAAFYIALVLCIGFLGAAGYLYMQLDTTKGNLVNTKEEARTLNIQLQAMARAKVGVEDELASEQKRANNLDRAKRMLEKKLMTANQTIAQLQAAIMENKEIRTLNKELELKLAEAINKKEALERQLIETKHEHEKELKQLQQQKLEMEQRLQEKTGEIPGAVRIENIKILTGKKFSGKVVAVNRKYNFIVINIGKNHGIEEGTVLIVHRGKKFIGKARIDRVYETMSAANLLEDWMQDRVETGDGVKKF